MARSISSIVNEKTISTEESPSEPLVHPYNHHLILQQGKEAASLIGWETDKCCALFGFYTKGILQSLDYVKNLQNVPGHRGLKGENVNP